VRSGLQEVISDPDVQFQCVPPRVAASADGGVTHGAFDISLRGGRYGSDAGVPLERDDARAESGFDVAAMFT